MGLGSIPGWETVAASQSSSEQPDSSDSNFKWLGTYYLDLEQGCTKLCKGDIQNLE